MRTPMIVLQSPCFRHHLRFMPVGENPTIQTLRSERTVEALNKGDCRA